MLLVPDHPDEVVVASNKGLYRGTGIWDGNVQWERLLEGNFYDIAASPTQPEVLLVARQYMLAVARRRSHLERVG